MTDSKTYIESILKNVRFKEAHFEIEKEIQGHIDELSETFSSFIENKDELQKEVLRRMGNPDEVGRKLDLIHRPRIDGMILVPLSLLILSGISIMFTQVHLGQHLLWLILGTLLAAVIVFMKPKLSEKSSLGGFLTVISVTAFSFFSSTTVAGQPYLSFLSLNIKIVDLSAALLVLFVPGLLLFTRKGKSQSLISLILLASPLWIYFKTNSVFPAAAYGIALLAMMTVYGSSMKATVSVSALGALGIFLRPELNGFAESQTLENLKLSERHTDFAMTTLHTWSPFIALVATLCAILFCTRLFATAKVIKSFQGKIAVTGIASFISMGVFWGLIANLGFAPMPITGVNFPFVSYGGSMMIAQLIMVGFVLSYYRRKNLIDTDFMKLN